MEAGVRHIIGPSSAWHIAQHYRVLALVVACVAELSSVVSHTPNLHTTANTA